MKNTHQKLLLGIASAAVFTLLFYLSQTQAQDPYVSEENRLTTPEADKPEINHRPEPKAEVPKPGYFPQSLIKLSANEFYSPFAFVVDKSLRTLSVWKQSAEAFAFIAAYPVDIGKQPGDKTNLGDQKTPEGIYFFQNMLEGSRLNFDEYGVRAFTTDYPNFFDLMNRKSGSGIWLHSIPDTKSLWRGSRGCIVVRNESIKELSQYITIEKTPLIIEDKVQFLNSDSFKQKQANWLTWLEQWKTSWESKSIEKYIGFYGDQFNSLGMNRSEWRKYKENLNSKYNYIHVKIKEPNIFARNDIAIIRFLQIYQSDKNSDFGEKTLYLKKNGDDFVIVAETWKPLGQDLLAKLENESSNKTQ